MSLSQRLTKTKTNTLTSPTTTTQPAATGDVKHVKHVKGPTTTVDQFDAPKNTSTTTPTTTQASTSTQATATFAPLTKRRLPALREALLDATIAPLSVSSLPVPAAVTAALAAAKRVLVVGHAHPADGDCVGSALALKKGLEALGKDVVAVVDQALPKALRGIDEHGELRRADSDDVKVGGFDLVVMVDVAQSQRTGAMANIIQAAAHVVVIDHHDVADLGAAVGAGDGATLTPWVDVAYDAAAVQVGAAVAHTAKAMGKDVDAAVSAAKNAAAAGLYTDTLGFKAPGASMESLQLFKGLVGSGETGLQALSALEGRLTSTLPAAVNDAIDGALTRHQRPGPLGTESVIVVDDAKLKAALALLQQRDPRAVLEDVTAPIMNALDDAAGAKGGCGHALLAMPAGDGWRVSVRGVGALAIQEALSSEGGGKPGAAVAYLKGDVDVFAACHKGLSEHMLRLSAQLRVGR